MIEIAWCCIKNWLPVHTNIKVHVVSIYMLPVRRFIISIQSELLQVTIKFNEVCGWWKIYKAKPKQKRFCNQPHDGTGSYGCTPHFNCTISSFYLRTWIILNKGKRRDLCDINNVKCPNKKRGKLRKLILWNQPHRERDSFTLCVESRCKTNRVLSRFPCELTWKKHLKVHLHWAKVYAKTVHFR